jgi:Flp pilus assembly protein TadG
MSARGALRCERGAELIEMAVVLPVLLLVIMGIVDFGFLFQRYVVLTNAVMEGARVATLPGYTGDDAVARVQAYALNGGITGTVDTEVLPVTLPSAAGGSWPGVQVTATHVYSLDYVGPIAALFTGGGGAVTLTARSTMRSQMAAAP